MHKVLREPLVHFLLIGAGLFVLFGQVQDGAFLDKDKQVVVSAGRIQQLEIIFTKTWQRPPGPEELKGLIDDFILEEIYYRQAKEMGIDRDDTVIRRRLRQKFEFLTDDMASAIQPTNEELKEYLSTNAEAFMSDALYSFEQVYISPEHADLEVYIADQLTRLKAGETVNSDSALLPTRFHETPARPVDSSFGKGFSEKLDQLTTGQWQGPIESGLGMHLVLLETRVEGALPELEEIRPVVEREWKNAKRLETRRLINEQLLNEYEIVIDWPAE